MCKASPTPAFLAGNLFVLGTCARECPGSLDFPPSFGQWLLALVLFWPSLFSQGDLGLEELVTLG